MALQRGFRADEILMKIKDLKVETYIQIPCVENIFYRVGVCKRVHFLIGVCILEIYEIHS
jgi:hypothetical protein